MVKDFCYQVTIVSWHIYQALNVHQPLCKEQYPQGKGKNKEKENSLEKGGRNRANYFGVYTLKFWCFKCNDFADPAKKKKIEH